MDSGNSGSLHSSSGADEECDSRAAVEAHARFITTHHQTHPPPPSFNHHMFDQNQINNPLFFAASPQHQLLNLDSVVWSKTLPSFSDHHFFPSSSQPAAHTVPFSQVTSATTMTTTTADPITSINPPPPARNPKKRSRASRRAPTTVLTTDTSNFRAMVQEFTGIPAPPFASSSPPFPRMTTSFDLFGRPSSMMRSNTNNFDNLPQLPPYLLRPFPQKLQSSPSSSSSISSLLDSSNLLTTMQNTITFPSNSLNQSTFLNPKTTQNLVSSNGFGVIGQAQMNELHSNLPGLVSSKGTASTPTTSTTRNDDQMASGNWDGGGGGGGVNYTNGKESSRVTTDHHAPGMKGDQGFIEPWICSSD